MPTDRISAAAYRDTKPHYEILDGLRGVAAFIVIFYHVFECFSSTPAPHGYLAVDFFFVLSGFVIGYAYDNRWGKMTTGGFFRRRLIRLHPMVIMGCIIGAITFLVQGSVKWDGSSVGLGLVMLAMLSTMFMIPSAAGLPTEVRGNSEMFPLNGPYWSLFFEYIGNILYALLLRRAGTKVLGGIAAVSGLILAYISISQGQLGIGWTLADHGFRGGLIRMLFPYTQHGGDALAHGGLRRILRTVHLPCPGMDGGIRADHRQVDQQRMPVCRRPLLSALYDTLSVHVPLLRPYRLQRGTIGSDHPRDLARGHHPRCRMYPAGLVVHEVLRPPCPSLADEKISEHQITKKRASTEARFFVNLSAHIRSN